MAEAQEPPDAQTQCANAAAAWTPEREGIASEAIESEQAIALCEAATQVASDNGDVWAFLARAYRSAGRYSEALEAGDKAIALGSVDGLWERGVVLEWGMGVERNLKEAATWYRAAAEQRHALAQHNLGWLYHYGKGVEQDDAVAVGWWRKAAERGFVRSQNILAHRYYVGDGVGQDYAEAVRWWRKAAEQGHAEAQENLGWRYLDGKGVEVDYAEAAHWMREAAERGRAKAQTTLAHFYSAGFAAVTYVRGVPDYDQAAFWYRKAAIQGYSEAQHFLGLYLEAIAEDFSEAAEWFRKAANQGLQEAQYSIGKLYERGQGVEKSPKQAAHWYNRAADQGFADAQHGLGQLFERGEGVEKNHERAFYWYRKAAEKGFLEAQHSLGQLFKRGVERNHERGFYWYSKAAEQGHGASQNALGEIYEHGEGVEKNFGEASHWYGEAAERGEHLAQENLGYLYLSGRGVEKDIAEAMRWFEASFRPQINADELYALQFTSTMPTLIAQLEDGDARLRRDAIRSLRRLGAYRTVDDIAARLHDDNFKVRVQAILALTDLGDRRVIEALIDLLGDPDSSIRQLVALSLTELMGARAPAEAKDILLEEEQLTRAALPILVGSGVRVRPDVLGDYLVSDKTAYGDRDDVIDSLLLASDRRVISYLLNTLEEGSPDEIHNALEAMARFGGVEVLDPVLSHTQDSEYLVLMGNTIDQELVARHERGEMDTELAVYAGQVFVKYNTNNGSRVLLEQFDRDDADKEGLMGAMSTLQDKSAIERLKAYWESALVQELADWQQVEESKRDDDGEHSLTIRKTFLEDIARSLSNASSEKAISSFVKLFVDKLESGNEHYLDTTRTTLHKVDFERAVDPLLTAFDLATGVARFAVADALLELGEAEPFFELLGSGDDVTRSLAEGLVKAWGKAGPWVWPDKGLPAGAGAIISHFEDETLADSPAARAALVEALLALRQPHAADTLYSLSHHENKIVRTSARYALGELGDPRATELILELLVEESSNDFSKQLYLLKKSGDPRAVETLISFVDDLLDGSPADSSDSPGWDSDYGLDLEDTEVEWFVVEVVRTLQDMGDPRAVDLLTRLLSHESAYVRYVAVWALGNIGGSQAAGALATLMNDIDGDMRDSASIALGLLGDARALDHVIRAVSEGASEHLRFARDSQQAREAPLRALVELREDSAIDLLFTLYHTKSDLYRWEVDDVLFGTNALQDETVRDALNSRVPVPTLISLLSEAETYQSITLPIVQAIGERGAYTHRLALLKRIWNWRYADSIVSAQRIADDLRTLRLTLPKSQALSPYTLLLAATVASRDNNHSAALEWAEEGLATAPKQDFPLLIALSVLWAETLASRGDLIQAQRVLEEIGFRHIKELLPSERGNGLALIEIDLLMTKAFVLSKLGETREVISANYAAEESLKTSLRLNWITSELFDWLLGNRIAPIQQQALRIEGETYRQTATRYTDSDPRGPQEAYGRALMLLGQIEEALTAGDHESYAKAQQEVEKVALDSLTQQERIRFADQERQAIYERLKSSEEEVSRLRTELSNVKKKKAGKIDKKVKELQRNLRAKQKDLHAFVRSLKKKHGDIAAMWGKSPTDLAQLAERLSPKSGIVQFLVLERQSFAFVIRYDGSVEIESLNTEEKDVGLQCSVQTGDESARGCLDLTREVSRYRALLGAETVSEEDGVSRINTESWELGTLLSQALLDPIEAHIEDLTRLILVPNAILHSLPFAALPWKEGYLVEHMELTLLPASSLVGALLAPEVEAPRGLLALGNSIPNEPGWGALKGAEAEVAALRGHFPDLSPKHILTGEEAQRESVIGRDLSGFLLHFAVHAETGRKARQVRLLLTGGDLLYDDVIGLTIENAPLVVLSGCETGLGERLSGDEVYSLANAFLLARAQAVLFSLWLVDDSATSVLMEEFYRHFGDGKMRPNTAKALARAQREMIREGFPPKYWAGFVLSEWTTHPS